NMPWFARNNDIQKDLLLTTVTDFHKKLSKKFFEKLDNNGNEALKEIAVYDSRDPNNVRRPRRLIND
ncbi:hypothetical protein AVEN_269679-1, partial [Araneus ventricosus]